MLLQAKNPQESQIDLSKLSIDDVQFFVGTQKLTDLSKSLESVANELKPKNQSHLTLRYSLNLKN